MHTQVIIGRYIDIVCKRSRTVFGDNSTRARFPIILVIAGKNMFNDNTETQSLYVHKAHTNKILPQNTNIDFYSIHHIPIHAEMNHAYFQQSFSRIKLASFGTRVKLRMATCASKQHTEHYTATDMVQARAYIMLVVI